jgi:hypothetical protein
LLKRLGFFLWLDLMCHLLTVCWLPLTTVGDIEAVPWSLVSIATRILIVLSNPWGSSRPRLRMRSSRLRLVALYGDQ